MPNSDPDARFERIGLTQRAAALVNRELEGKHGFVLVVVEAGGPSDPERGTHVLVRSNLNGPPHILQALDSAMRLTERTADDAGQPIRDPDAGVLREQLNEMARTALAETLVLTTWTPKLTQILRALAEAQLRRDGP